MINGERDNPSRAFEYRARQEMGRQGTPDCIVTDKLRFYSAALKEVGTDARHETGLWLNDNTENSHLPFWRWKWAIPRFRLGST